MIFFTHSGKRAARLKCIPFCRRDEKNRRFVSFVAKEVA